MQWQYYRIVNVLPYLQNTVSKDRPRDRVPDFRHQSQHTTGKDPMRYWQVSNFAPGGKSQDCHVRCTT